MTSDQLGPEIRARSSSPLLAEGYGFGLGFTVRTDSARAALAGSIGDFSWGSEIRVHLCALTKNLVLAAIVD